MPAQSQVGLRGLMTVPGGRAMRRAAWLAGISVATIVLTAPARVEASPGYSAYWDDPGYDEPAYRPRRAIAPHGRLHDDRGIRLLNRRTPKSAAGKPEQPSIAPKGLLQVIVSIDKQQATLFSDGAPVATTKISTGTATHPTPMGVFTVIQKDRHHVSNLYDAPMPYMQRITWSGSALHQGPLPGRPASHGCVRLTTDFAQLLWKATRIGTRVIITRDAVTPQPIEHLRLFTPKPKPEQATAEPAPIKTADAANPSQALPVVRVKLPVEPAPLKAPDARRRTAPLSMFISLKEGRIYVRQAMEPLFDAPVVVASPDQPIGTHVYTAMEPNGGGGALRWNAISIPSGFKRPMSRENGRKSHGANAAEPSAATPSTAATALDRITIAPETIARIEALVTPGASLIVSDNKLSNETGTSTDFIVLTR